MAACVTLNNVSKFYGSKAAVRNLSLEIDTGEVVALLGPNGAGKSTTLYMLSGLVRPSSGEISIFGKDLRTQWLEIAPRIGVVVERPAFPAQMSIRRLLKMHARLSGHEANVDRVADMAGLLHASDTRAGELSQGTRQRLALALALLTEPRLLILDEPTSGLDPEAGTELLEWLRRVVLEAKVTVVFSTHMMREVEVLCDRAVVLSDGEFVAADEADALLSYDLRQVEILVEGPESVSKRLAEQSWVESATVKGNRILVRLDDATPQQLNNFLVQSGYAVSALRPRRRTLQEYFLRVANRNQEPQP